MKIKMQIGSRREISLVIASIGMIMILADALDYFGDKTKVPMFITYVGVAFVITGVVISKLRIKKG